MQGWHYGKRLILLAEILGHIMKLLVDVRGLYVCNFIVHLTNNHL